MSQSNLPEAATAWLARREMREHHAVWHYVRAFWNSISSADRDSFRQQGWEPPRLNPRGGQPDAGAGVDFIYMHRRMIESLNTLLQQIADPNYPRVVGWAAIPWDHDDPVWPMPPPYPGSGSKSPQATAFWRQEVADKFDNDDWLRGVGVDELGSEIENGIHNWMHMHWAAEPWFKGQQGQDEDDPRNDYLGSTYSSHVNKVFWKLHGWIDDRIGRWEAANGQPADLSQGWEGPSHTHHHAHVERAGPASAGGNLLDEAQRRVSERFFHDRAGADGPVS